jgi:hypothetical protein
MGILLKKSNYLQILFRSYVKQNTFQEDKTKKGGDNSILDFQSKCNNAANLFTHKNTKLKWAHVEKGRTVGVVHVPTSDLFIKTISNLMYLFHGG